MGAYEAIELSVVFSLREVGILIGLVSGSLTAEGEEASEGFRKGGGCI